MDVLDMNLISSNTFNCVIDKGTLDTVICSEDPDYKIQLMLNEIHRVLAPNGVYILISLGEEQRRLNYFVNNYLISRILNGSTR